MLLFPCSSQAKRRQLNLSRGKTGFLLPGWRLAALQKTLGLLPVLPVKQEEFMGEPHMCALVSTEDKTLILDFYLKKYEGRSLVEVVHNGREKV